MQELMPQEPFSSKRSLQAHQDQIYEIQTVAKVQSFAKTAPISNEPQITLYGGRVHGEASIEAGIDGDGNKHIEGRVKVENEEETVSGNASGQVSQDSDGNTKAEAKVGGTIRF